MIILSVLNLTYLVCAPLNKELIPQDSTSIEDAYEMKSMNKRLLKLRAIKRFNDTNWKVFKNEQQKWLKQL